jgi:cytochrome c-type biogenesis protein CcmF
MNQIGAWSLPAAIVVAIYAIVVSIIGARRKNHALTRSGENAVLAVLCLVTLAVAAVVSAIHRNDFSLAFVFAHSSRELPTFYKWTALWGGMEGSLLFWAWILCIYSGAVILQGRKRVETLMPYAVVVLMVIAIFFIGIINWLENPFEQLAVPAANGRGLNPLLQDPVMSFHPPTLYLGFVGLSVPFAFAMAALITGKLDTLWIERTRKWALGAWIFLTLGNLLGGWWAYHVLGWGGYWGWDPVENSAFLPWLTVTAYLH